MGGNPKPAYLVSYAHEFNATQEHIDQRIQATLPPHVRTSRITRVSGNHPDVVDMQLPNPDDPTLFTVHYIDVQILHLTV
jgi:hypothetical protein